jgi:hypothetical protein
LSKSLTNCQLNQNRVRNYQRYRFFPIPLVRGVNSNGQSPTCASHGFMDFYYISFLFCPHLPHSSHTLSFSLVLSLSLSLSLSHSHRRTTQPNYHCADSHPQQKSPSSPHSTFEPRILFSLRRAAFFIFLHTSILLLLSPRQPLLGFPQFLQNLRMDDEV